MTNEEAISIMKVIVHMLEEKYDTDRVEDAVDMAIKALEQEPCEDCISRKALLEEIENGIKAGNYEEGYEEYPHINDMDDIIECIKYADSIQPKPGWIPISERLPEPYQECLFTVIAFHWANEPVTYKVIQKAYGGEQDFIAWMPLPEPYKAESEDKEWKTF